MKSLLIALLCCIVISTQAQTKKNKEKSPKAITVFTVNKKSITANEFIYLYKKNHQNKTEDFTSEKIEEYLTLFINFKLKVEEARHRGLDTTTAFKKEYNSYKDELRKPYLPDSKLTDSLVKLTYNRLTEEVRASHILINLKPDATPADTLQAFQKITDVRNKALAGEDFGTLAVEFSEDPSAKGNKGDLGYFTAMQMVYPFENGAYTTPVGQISKPVRTRYGYHILKVYDRKPTRGEVEVSHIMLRTGDNKDNEKAKNKIFEIYDQLRAGVKWEELCKQFSEDPGTKDNGGRLRPFGVGAMASVPAFEQAAFVLKNPGDISDPFQSQYGWHIVRLERKIPVQTYDEMATALKAKVARDERVQISKQALQVNLRKEYKLQENAVVKVKVMALADSSLKKGKWLIPPYVKSEKEILFTLTGKGFTVKNFLLYVKKNQHASSLTPAEFMDQLYTAYIDASILDILEQNLMANNPDYKMLLNEYYEGILLFEIMEKEIWNKASEDSVGQHAYFEKHQANYLAKERADLDLYSASSKPAIDGLMALLKTSDSTKIAEYISAQKIKREKGRFEKEERAVLDKVTWAKGMYQAENNSTYYLAVINSIIPPGAKTFDEARASVISDYQNHLEQVWITQLEQRYPVKINDKGKKYVFEQLQKN